jgi:hypothetical protein
MSWSWNKFGGLATVAVASCISLNVISGDNMVIGYSNESEYIFSARLSDELATCPVMVML